MLTWTSEIGRVLGAIVDGGAKVVGFDIVMPTSLEQSEIPFGDGVLGDKVRGFDRDFLRALASASSAGKVVLGEVLRGDQPIRPSQGQRIAVRQQQNIRPLNVYTDSDDAVRRVPLTFPVSGGAPLPGMALELASRALKTAPEFAADGTVTLAGYRIPGEVAEHHDRQFRRRRGRHPDLLVRRSALLRHRQRQGLFPALVRRQSRHLRQRAGRRGSQIDVETVRDRPRRRAHAALHGRDQAGERRLQAQLDRRRLYPCDRRQQPDPARRRHRTRAACRSS